MLTLTRLAGPGLAGSSGMFLGQYLATNFEYLGTNFERATPPAVATVAPQQTGTHFTHFFFPGYLIH